MKENGITILGTAGDSTAMGRQLRASGGIVITTPENQIVIDPAPGTLVRLSQNNFHPRETTAILVTHMHVGHAGDAAALISSMTHNGIDRRGVLVQNTQEDPFISANHTSWVEKTITAIPGRKIGINDVNIVAVNTEHYDSNSIGYLIQTPNYIVGYTSDTRYTEEIAKQFKDANILIVNCKLPNDNMEGDHLNTENVISILKHCSPQLVVLTHFGSKMISVDPLAQARKVHHETKAHVIAAKDGLFIAPSSYDVKQKQKSLSNF